MKSAGDSELGTMEAQPASKEWDWKQLQTLRVNQLESYLKKAQDECFSLREKYQQLREDFQFNLAILDERDRELERYDAKRKCNRSVTGKVQKQRKKYERTNLDLEHRTQVLEENLSLQKQEMTATFESELRQREHEFNLKINEMHAVLLSHTLKVKVLSKKSEIYYQAYLQATEALKKCKERCLQIQAQLHHRDQEVKDLTAVKEKRYNRDLATEMKIITLQEREARLKTELESNKEAIDRYKQQLSDGLKRERTLEQIQVQMALEWQRHCEDIKAKHYIATEQLIQDLIQARDQAEAELKEKKQELQDLTETKQAIQDSTSEVVVETPLKKIHHLQEQNSILRAAVTQMRKDIESFNHLTQPQHPVICASPKPQMMRTDGLTNRASKLQEENQDLHHQQASGPLSGGLFKNAQDAKSNPTVMHTRMRKAASCIAHLCREKQQLIEMTNRLRAQITATVLQEQAEKDSSTKKQGKQQDQLSSLLGKLQELPVRQKVCTINEHPGTSNQGPSTNEASSSWSQGHKTARPKKTLNTQPHSGLARSQLSSEESLQSLKEFWETLDLQLSSSIVSQGDDDLSCRDMEESESGVQMMVHSSVLPLMSKPQLKPSRR